MTRTVELGAVLAGEVIGQIAGPTAAAHIRAGRLVPLLLDHMTDMYSLFLYYGSRAASPPGYVVSSIWQSSVSPTARSSCSVPRSFVLLISTENLR